MRAAVLHTYGEAPEYRAFEEPRGGNGHVVVEVEAAGVNHLDLLKASGTHFSGSAAASLGHRQRRGWPSPRWAARVL